MAFNENGIENLTNKFTEIFDKKMNRLFKISDDIREFELFLIEKNIKKMMSITNGAGSALVWNPERKRFLYSELIKNAESAISKPLCECKLSIKEKMYPYLPEFIKMMADNIDEIIK